MRPFLLIFLVVPALIAIGCTSDSRRTLSDEEAGALIGTWSADDTTRFNFEEDGEALWIFGEGETEDTFRIQYDYAADVEPAQLELSGFDRGFLQGRTLYCIVAFDSVSVFRMDCEPGGGTDSGVRPDTFTQSSMVYRAAADSLPSAVPASP